MSGIEASEFRRVLGHFATGVAVVCVRDPATEEPRGLTVSALCSVSLDPPLVLVCVERSADTHGPLSEAGAFSINILDGEQERLSRVFAEGEAPGKFEGIAWHEEATASPVLDDALAWIDCRTWQAYPGGDHTIFVGEVVDGDARAGSPLVYYRGGYGRYTP